MSSMSLKEYLINQGVPVQVIAKLVEYRKTHGKFDESSPYYSRIRAPRTMYVDAYKDTDGKIVSKGILRRCLSAMLAGHSVLLRGPKGSGKNTLADTCGYLMNRPMFEVEMHVHTDSEALLGRDSFKAVPVEREVLAGVDSKGSPIKTTVVERQGEVVFELAQFAEACKIGGIVTLDELNMCRPEAAAVLHSVLDDRKRVDIPGYGLLNVHPATRVIGTMNHGYAGTQELNEALQDRFVLIEVPPMTVDEITVFLESRFPGITNEFAGQLAKLFHDMLALAETQKLQSRDVTFRGLPQACDLILTGLTPHEAATTCIVSRSSDTMYRNVLQGLVDSRIKKSWSPSDVIKPVVE